LPPSTVRRISAFVRSTAASLDAITRPFISSKNFTSRIMAAWALRSSVVQVAPPSIERST
jgi:hypothetical protein